MFPLKWAEKSNPYDKEIRYDFKLNTLSFYFSVCWMFGEGARDTRFFFQCGHLCVKERRKLVNNWKWLLKIEFFEKGQKKHNEKSDRFRSKAMQGKKRKRTSIEFIVQGNHLSEWRCVDGKHFVHPKKIQNCAILFFSHLNVYLTPHVMSPLMIQLVFHQNFTLPGKNSSFGVSNDIRHASPGWNAFDVTYFCITILAFFSN